MKGSSKTTSLYAPPAAGAFAGGAPAGGALATGGGLDAAGADFLSGLLCGNSYCLPLAFALGSLPPGLPPSSGSGTPSSANLSSTAASFQPIIILRMPTAEQKIAMRAHQKFSMLVIGSESMRIIVPRPRRDISRGKQSSRPAGL